MMIKEIFDSSKIESYHEQFFAEMLDFGNLRFYPFYDLSLIISKSGSGTCSINPIAMIICELENNEILDYYLYYFNSSDENEELTGKILIKFSNEVNIEAK